MENIISDLWEKGLLPIKGAIYFVDGRSLSLKIKSYPRPLIERGLWFDFEKFYKENKNEVSNIDVIKSIKVIDGFCLVGEGSYGSEGFVAYLGRENKLRWVIYSENSNPFVHIERIGVYSVLIRSSADFKVRIDLRYPENIEIAC